MEKSTPDERKDRPRAETRLKLTGSGYLLAVQPPHDLTSNTA
jgi:hypothetical protein